MLGVGRVGIGLADIGRVDIGLVGIDRVDVGLVSKAWLTCSGKAKHCKLINRTKKKRMAYKSHPP